MTDERPHPVALVIDNAQPAQPPPKRKPETQGVGVGGGDGSDGGSTPRREDGLPEGCPIEPLGIKDDLCFYIDAHRQVRALKARDHSHLNLRHLFGTQSHLLLRHWPRLNRDGVPVGFRPEAVAEDLMKAAARKGVWNAFERLRGPGAWLDAEGGLVLHAGNAILIGGEWVAPGHIAGRYVYPASDPQPRPAKSKPPGDAGAAAEAVLETLKTWRWRRADRDPELLLGWICAAMIGGALEWRPMCWVTGDKGTGKSTLHSLIKRLLGGDEAIIAVSDASAAGVWQKLGQSSLPVSIDELEAEEDNRRAQSIIKLARQAASGGVILRGGADHQGAEFKARSCFLFSSILVPPLPSQDRSRMAILELGTLGTHEAPALEPKRLAELGGQLRRRLLEGWPRFADTLHAYRTALAVVGHTGRGADQFGTILACLDLVRSDFPPSSEELEEWAEKLKPSIEESSEDDADHYRCVQHLLTSVVDVFRGGRRRTVSEWIQQRIGLPETPGENVNTAEAEKALGTLGLKVLYDQSLKGWYIAVANYHQGLAALFEHTHWAGRSGTMGVWVQALRRCAGAEAGNLRFAGVAARCTKLPLSVLMPDAVAEAGADHALL